MKINIEMIVMLSLFSASLFILSDVTCHTECTTKRILSSVCILFNIIQMFILVSNKDR